MIVGVVVGSEGCDSVRTTAGDMRWVGAIVLSLCAAAAFGAAWYGEGFTLEGLTTTLATGATSTAGAAKFAGLI